MKRKGGCGKLLAGLLLAAVLIVVVVAGAVAVFGPGWMRKTVEGEGFRAMLSREVSKALKVEGEFAPLQLDGWTARTDSYQSTGLPGEAIAGLDAHGISGTFDPWGVLKSQWLLSLIMVERGSFHLRLPDDALKQPPVVGKRPWYAALMPQYFHVNWIECPSADVLFPLGTLQGGLKGVHLGATMVEQNFRYYVKEGELTFPGFPALQVDALEVFVTRDMVQVDYGYLRAPEGSRGKLEVSGRMGQRADKSIDARVKVEDFEIDAFLPEEVRPLLDGELNGVFDYQVDATGKQMTGSGKLEWAGAGLEQWGVLQDVARVAGRSSLERLEGERVAIDYRLEGNTFYLDQFSFTAAGLVRMEGPIAYDLKTTGGKLDLKVDQMPVSVWMPQELKVSKDTMLSGEVHWEGTLKEWEQSSGGGRVGFADAHFENPVRTIAKLGVYAPEFPAEIRMERAELVFGYQDRAFTADDLQLVATDFFVVQGSGSWSMTDDLEVDVAFAFPRMESWLPKVLEKHLSGSLDGKVRWQSRRLDLEGGKGNGALRLKGAVLQDFGFQTVIARFLSDTSWMRLTLDTASLEWRYGGGSLEVEAIDLMAGERAGIRGAVTIREGGEVSGKVRVGLVAEALEWLPGATESIFTEVEEGLHWAEVTLSGTTRKLEQDLVDRVMRELRRHPGAMAKLALKGVSWWLGDVLDTEAAHPEREGHEP